MLLPLKWELIIHVDRCPFAEKEYSLRIYMVFSVPLAAKAEPVSECVGALWCEPHTLLWSYLQGTCGLSLTLMEGVGGSYCACIL